MKQVYEMHSFKQLLRFFFLLSFVAIFITIMSPFIIPCLIGGIFAAGLNPAAEYLIRRRFRRKKAALVVVLAFTLGGLLPLLFSCIRGTQILYEYINKPGHIDFKVSLQNLVNDFCAFIGRQYKFDPTWIKNTLYAKITVLEAFVLRNFDALALEIPNLIFITFLTVVTLYLLLRNGDSIRHPLVKLAATPKSGERVLDILEKCAKDIFMTNILTGLLQAFIVSLGSLVFTSTDFFLVFVLTFMLSFIPVIGAAPVALVLCLLSFSDHDTVGGLGLILVAMVAGVSDNIIRPYLVSRGSLRVHPFINFLSIIGGVFMFGFAGLFIGPFVVGVCVGAVPIIFVEFVMGLKPGAELIDTLPVEE